MERRIAASEAHSNLLDELAAINLPGEDYKLFDTKQKALMFAAGLGWHLRRRTPLKSRDSSAAIRFDIFEKAVDDGFVDCLGVAETRGLAVLANESNEEMARIFEEYANTGLNAIQEKVMSQMDPLHALVDLMLQARNPAIEEGLEGVDPDILGNLLGY